MLQTQHLPAEAFLNKHLKTLWAELKLYSNATDTYLIEKSCQALLFYRKPKEFHSII